MSWILHNDGAEELGDDMKEFSCSDEAFNDAD